VVRKYFSCPHLFWQIPIYILDSKYGILNNLVLCIVVQELSNLSKIMHIQNIHVSHEEEKRRKTALKLQKVQYVNSFVRDFA
jgi:hypothetical protein